MNATTPPPSEGKSPRVREVPAVSRALAILRLLASRPESMTLKAISDELGLVASTCLHILRVLVEEGMVKVEAATKRYSLDVGVLSLAQSVVEQNPFPVRVQNVLEEISAEWDVTTIGMKVSGLEDLVVLALARSKGPFRLYVEVGSRVPALTSATGRLVAHYMELSDEALSSKFEELNWENPPAFDAWLREIRAVERKGFAIDRGNYINGISVLAIPILNRQHKMTYAIAALGVTNRFSAADLQDLGKYMQSRASTLAG